MGTPPAKKNSDKKTRREKIPPRPVGQAPLLNLPDDATAASKTNKPMRHGTPKSKKHADKILPDNIC